MDKKQNSDCWYYAVCCMDNPCDSCIRYLEMKFLMDNSGLSKAKQLPVTLVPDDIDYDSFVRLQEIKNDIINFVDDGKNLFIGGNIGNGKTSWAIKILLKYFDSVWLGNGFRVRGVFVHVPTLLTKLKDFDNPLSADYKDTLINSDLVIWDEVGGIGMSNYDYSQLLTFIDSRMFNEKANIYTANIETEMNCSKYLGTKLTSRIWNASERVILQGRDRR